MFGAFFKEQVSIEFFALDTFYILAVICLFLVVAAFGLIDSGLVRRKNLLDTWVQKILASLFAALAFIVVGFGIWNWQFNEAFGVPNALGESIKAWWIGGVNMRTFSHNLDPAAVPEADVLQIFSVF